MVCFNIELHFATNLVNPVKGAVRIINSQLPKKKDNQTEALSDLFKLTTPKFPSTDLEVMVVYHLRHLPKKKDFLGWKWYAPS